MHPKRRFNSGLILLSQNVSIFSAKIKAMNVKIFTSPLWLLCFLLSFQGYAQQSQSIMTYNIRYNNPNDGENIWDHRKASLVKEILFYEPDFIGLQEAVEEQVQYIDQHLPQYTYIGVGRNDGQKDGEYCAIFYHKDRVKNVSQHTFWLSETPDQPSKGWDANIKRICTYGQFQYLKGRKKIYVFNTHFDHRGHEARKQSAQLILTKIREITQHKYPTLLMGDFNLSPDSAPIQSLSSELQDSYIKVENPPFGPSTTFTGFDIQKEGGHRIDYIFGNEKIKFHKTAILSHWIDRHFNSDHFPVYSTFRILK